MSPIPAVTMGRSLVVFLENGGSFGPWVLPSRVRRCLDFSTEEVAKRLLHWHNVSSAYDDVWILEDHRALPEELMSALLGASVRHTVDVLILAHGCPAGIVGWQGAVVGDSFFAEMQSWRERQAVSLRLRMVYTIACHSVHQMLAWRQLGAQVVNGISGENWLPEPTLSLFLRRWGRGQPFGVAATTAHHQAYRWGTHVMGRHPLWHKRLTTSQQCVVGTRDITIHNTCPGITSLSGF